MKVVPKLTYNYDSGDVSIEFGRDQIWDAVTLTHGADYLLSRDNVVYTIRKQEFQEMWEVVTHDGRRLSNQ